MGVHANDAVWRDLFKRAVEMRTLKARVGILASKGGGAQHEGSDLTLVEIFAIHEFGSEDGHVPERAPLRATFAVRVADQLKDVIAVLVGAVMRGAIDARTAVNRLGAWGAAQVKNTITQNESDSYGPYPYPPNADSTIAKKGSSVPLVDTAQMLNAITWEVVDSGKGGGE